MKKIVLVLSLLLSMYSICSKDIVNFWIHPEMDHMEEDGLSLYMVGVSISSYPPNDMTWDDEVEKYRDARFRMNDVEYYYADFNFVLKDIYTGRDRKEPYIWLKAGDKVSIELLEGFPQALSFNLYVPEVVDSITISPELVLGQKALGSYVVTWSEVECDHYSYMVSNMKGGSGNIVESNFLDISNPTEWIEVEINSKNSLEIDNEVIKLRASISGPIPQKVSNFSWDDPSIWDDEPIVMYEEISPSDSPAFLGNGFFPEGPIMMTEDDPSGFTPESP